MLIPFLASAVRTSEHPEGRRSWRVLPVRVGRTPNSKQVEMISVQTPMLRVHVPYSSRPSPKASVSRSRSSQAPQSISGCLWVKDLAAKGLEVLHDGGEVELVTCAGETPQAR